jgi:hypothetical protein
MRLFTYGQWREVFRQRLGPAHVFWLHDYAHRVWGEVCPHTSGGVVIEYWFGCLNVCGNRHSFHRGDSADYCKALVDADAKEVEAWMIGVVEGCTARRGGRDRNE